jgi:hypothetical protein
LSFVEIVQKATEQTEAPRAARLSVPCGSERPATSSQDCENVRGRAARGHKF